eukprot:2266590-Rhodomonas_salina.1
MPSRDRLVPHSVSFSEVFHPAMNDTCSALHANPRSRLSPAWSKTPEDLYFASFYFARSLIAPSSLSILSPIS